MAIMDKREEDRWKFEQALEEGDFVALQFVVKAIVLVLLGGFLFLGLAFAFT